jgi:flagellar hook-associated protein 1 FlgK
MLNILNVAQTGLSTSQTQVEGVMNNLANENTPGYKRRVVNVSELSHADARLTGRGVSMDGVSRVTDIYMYQNLVREEARLTSLKEFNSMLNDIESIFKETEDSGLSADLHKYFKSIENLRTSPQNEIYKNDLKSNANILVSDLKSLYENIEKREESALKEAKESVAEINNILTSI